MSTIPSRPIVPHIASSCPKCSIPLEFPVPQPYPRPGTLLQIQCFSCQSILTHAFYPNQVPSTSSATTSSSSSRPSNNNQPSRGGRKIGTQDRPLETAYYDILGVPITATSDDIKKAYRRLAIKHHPDKNPDDPHAEERFKAIAIAYQTLSDPDLRKKYNEFGARESAPEGGFVDPEEVFGAMFGGERFVPIIGVISLAKDMKAALQEADEEDGQGEGAGAGTVAGKEKTPEEKARKEEKDKKKAAEKAAARQERVAKLVENLERKLSIFTESAAGPDDPDVTSSWRTICELEAESLKSESYGSELLQCIGFVYVSKAKAHQATNQSFLGVGGWLHNVQGKYHVFSETVSTLRSAIELKNVFEQLQAAERAGNLTPEERKRLEEEAAEKGVKALFKGTKLEVESILRDTCDQVLEFATTAGHQKTPLPPNKAQLRAIALRILGEAYMKAGAGAGQQQLREGGEDEEYVRVDTKNSRAREKERSDRTR